MVFYREYSISGGVGDVMLGGGFFLLSWRTQSCTHRQEDVSSSLILVAPLKPGP